MRRSSVITRAPDGTRLAIVSEGCGLDVHSEGCGLDVHSAAGAAGSPFLASQPHAPPADAEPTYAEHLSLESLQLPQHERPPPPWAALA